MQSYLKNSSSSIPWFTCIIILVIFLLIWEWYRQNQTRVYTEHETLVACKLFHEAHDDTICASSTDDVIERLTLTINSIAKLSAARKIVGNDEILHSWTKLNPITIFQINEMCYIDAMQLLKKN
jgi:hypothetical protein